MDDTTMLVVVLISAAIVYFVVVGILHYSYECGNQPENEFIDQKGGEDNESKFDASGVTIQ